MAISPIAARHFGAGDHAQIGRYTRQGIYLGLGLGIATDPVAQFAVEPLLTLIGIDPEFRDLTVGYVGAIMFGAPGIFIFLALRFTTEGIGHTRPIMFTSMFCADLQRVSELRADVRQVRGTGDGRGRLWRGQRDNDVARGAGAGIAHVLQSTLSAIQNLLAGGAAASVGVEGNRRSGRADRYHDYRRGRAVLGRFDSDGHPRHRNNGGTPDRDQLFGNDVHDPAGAEFGNDRAGRASLSAPADMQSARISGAVGIGLCASFMALSAMFLLVFRDAVVGLYTDDPAVRGIAISLLLMAAIFQIADGVQIGAAGALRGYKDTRVPMAVNMFAYWVLAFPLAFLAAITFKAPPNYVWGGFVVGLGIAAMLLTWRYHSLSRINGLAD